MKKKPASQTAPKPSRKNAILLAAAVLAFFVSGAFGATTSWTLQGTGNWFTGENWSNGEPDSTTDAQINNSGTAQISADAPMAEALSLTLGLNAGESGTVEVSPPFGDLTVGEAIFVGKGGSGKLTITQGTVISATASIASLTNELVSSNGVAIVDGTHHSAWAITGRFDVGGYNDTPGGVALLSVTNGGSVSAASLHVYSSGTLTGNGTVSTTTSGTTVEGTLEPSGQLTIGGNLTFAGIAPTMQCNVVPASADNVNITSGTATLSGRLSVTMTGTFTLGTQYTLLTTDLGRIGTFSSYSIKFPPGQNFSPQINYDANHVYLYLASNTGP